MSPISVPSSPPVLPRDYTPPPKLSAEEETKRAHLVHYFSDTSYRLSDREKDELSDDERFWLSSECILRYLRASKWKTDVAISRLEATLRWRREYGLYDKLTADHVEPEAVTGKQILSGYDVKRQPCWYMMNSRENTEQGPRQIQFTVWILERAIELMGPGVESVVIMTNYADNTRNTSISTAKTVLNILQDHYPERLSIAFLIKIPFLLNAFMTIVSAFLDPVTRAKWRINADVVEGGFVAKESLWQDGWGGDVNFVYDHKTYWAALLAMCAERREREKEAWRDLGGSVGLSEFDVKTRAAGNL